MPGDIKSPPVTVPVSTDGYNFNYTLSGPEENAPIKIYDDGKGKIQPKNSAGALYDLYEPNSEKQLQPPGEYNTAKIVVRGDKIEHWLNGRLIVSATVGDEEWQRRVAASKFSDAPDFSRNPRGKLMLTDHGSEVWYRNFVFEPLGANK